MNQGCNLNRREDDFMYVHKARIVQDIASCLQEFYTSFSTPTPTFRDAQICKELHLGHLGCDHVEGIRHSIHQRVLLLDGGEIHTPMLRICEYEVGRRVGLDVLHRVEQLFALLPVLPLEDVVALEVDEEEQLQLVHAEVRIDLGERHDGDEVLFGGDDIVKEDDSRDFEYAKIGVSSEDKSIVFSCIFCNVSKNQKQ